MMLSSYNHTLLRLRSQSLITISHSSMPPRSPLSTLPAHTISYKKPHILPFIKHSTLQHKPQSKNTNNTPTTVCYALPSAPTSLLAQSPWGIWACLTLAGAAGLHLERTKWGKEMSGALLSTLIGLALSNLQIIPSEAIQYGVVNSYLLPLAVPLLLFGADLRKVIKDTGRLLFVFFCGAVGTVIGSFTAFSFVPLNVLGDDGWKVAAALTARHIGGSVNYMAVSETLSLSPNARMAGLAADDLIVAGYFTLLYSLARKVPPEEEKEEKSSIDEGRKSEKEPFSVLYGATALAVSACLCALGTSIASALMYKGGSITVITFLTIGLATTLPRFVAPLISSGEAMAAILMQLFFASVGASGNIQTVLKTAPTLFIFSFVSISVHVIVMLVGERWFGFSRKEMCLASNANIGGPTTAAGMAASKKWNSRVIPALLIGICGYATATFIGIGSGIIFRKMQYI